VIDIIYAMTEYVKKLIDFEKEHEPLLYEDSADVLMDSDSVSTIKNKQLEDVHFVGVFC